MPRLPLKLRYMLKQQVKKGLMEAQESPGDEKTTEEMSDAQRRAAAAEEAMDAAQAAMKFYTALLKAKEDFDESATEQQQETIQQFDFDGMLSALKNMLPPDSYSSGKPAAAIKSGMQKQPIPTTEKEELLK